MNVEGLGKIGEMPEIIQDDLTESTAKKENLVYLVCPADYRGNVDIGSKFTRLIENPEDLPKNGKWPKHEGPDYITEKGSCWFTLVLDANTGQIVN